MNSIRRPEELSRRAMLRLAGGGLATAAVASTFGCSGSGSGSGAAAANLPKGPQVELPAPTAGPVYPSPYKGPKAYVRKPFTTSSKTFRVVVPQDPTVGDWNNNQFSTWLEQRTGVKVKYEALNVASPDGSPDLTKVNAMIASGDLPDAFLALPFDPAQVSLYGSQGLFTDLTDYIQRYAPVQRQQLTDLPALAQYMKAQNGRFFMMGSVNDCYHCNNADSKAFVHKKYLSKVGASMPTTVDEFRSLLKEFKARNPSGKSGFLPFIGDDPTVEGIDVWFMCPFMYNPGGGSTWMRLNDGKVEFVANTDAWRQGLSFMRDLYDDGTFTKQVFSITSAELIALGNNGKLGAVRAYFPGAFVNIDETPGSQYREWEPIMPLKGTGATGRATYDYNVPAARTFVVTKKCANPEIMVQWADYQADLEPVLRAYYGTGGAEGDGWTYATTGEKGLDGRQAVWAPTKKALARQNAPAGLTWNQNFMGYRSRDFRDAQFDDPKNPDYEADLYQWASEYAKYSQPQDWEIPSVLIDSSDTANIANIQSTITNYVQSSMAKFATAELDVHSDAAWKKYTSTLNQMNLSQMIDIQQKAYDNRPK